GARRASLDPLQWTPLPSIPALSPAYYGLGETDLATRFSMEGVSFWQRDATLAELHGALQETYCGTLASEFMHLASEEQRLWWQQRLESTRAKPSFSADAKRRILERLTVAEGLETYLHTRYVGQKRFSLEGGESLIPLLDELVRGGAAHGISNVVMGMAHRGRLNVLLNVAEKPARALFREFEGQTDEDLLAGDVKYHKGYTGTVKTDAGVIEVVLAYNASHLEFVNPVVQGIARAKAEQRRAPASSVLPVEIHGDAAIVGQGIVSETLNMSYVRGHTTGGTVHVVLNNQVGFTTSDTRDTRSSYFCTDIAKMIEAPVLHVNGDDPEAVVLAAQLALEYRTTFGRSVFIELVCFRRHGHQEQDTPMITQPLMYRAIAAHPGVRSLYAKRLQRDHVLRDGEADELLRVYRAALDSARDAASSPHQVSEHPSAHPSEHSSEHSSAEPSAHSPAQPSSQPYTPPAPESIRDLAGRIVDVPASLSLHPLVAKVLDSRRDMAAGTRPLDWGMGEHLAFASLLADGVDVRLAGQDSERGTFSHRHAVLHDQGRTRRSEGTYVPLEHIASPQGRFQAINSVLSEAAVLAFEYGYSVTRPEALVLWEAQFGDFANGAQVVIDQFISAGEAKWGQRSGLVMLLPHGQEGQGPEHASARLERYLQLCAQENLRVCQPTEPAQLFHLLRAQALLQEKKPLVLMTPKSLLRHPAATSSLRDLAQGAFRPVIGDIVHADPAAIRQVIVCTGKVYFDLAERRKTLGLDTVALVRVEQLYPFPVAELQAELNRYPNAGTIVWCQEEAQNQGAWTFAAPRMATLIGTRQLRYAGSPEAASTAPGSHADHMALRESLLRSALELDATVA
ncbi:MAG TPA: 2-oxoglutarate dehydrogenase E1 component, partial [Bordetella sp.]|nr:2-oxoglutarate dehydrogenase E1 component [Bordetella sp.]